MDLNSTIFNTSAIYPHKLYIFGYRSVPVYRSGPVIIDKGLNDEPLSLLDVNLFGNTSDTF